MTTELQRAMAQYEEARVAYKKAVLGSLNGASNGDAIRQAIQAFQRASAELKRLVGAPAPSARAQKPPGEAVPFPGWSLVRRLLKAS
jgi:hypothetical protein